MKTTLTAPEPRPPRISNFDIELTLLLEAIYLKYQHDFRHYAMSSLRRRLTQALDEFGLTPRCRSCRTGSCEAARISQGCFNT
jgi:chemotaxis protein methyltransferase CheR